MSSSGDLVESLRVVADRVDDDMSERDVENLFLETGFYDALGFEGTGVDIRSEFTLDDDRRPDYITLDTNEAVTTVYEFKTSGRSLPPHESQLFHYMDNLRADYGVLTNGEELRLYRRGEETAVLAVSVDTVAESDARDLFSALQKREFDLTDPNDVNQFLSDLDPIPLDERAKLGQEHFFDTFRLEEDSPFADLVIGMMDLLHELRDEQDAKFVKGAYDFWEATYADEPDEVPSSWEPFIDGKQSLRDFMFCLESGHALLARLLLAKATEDHDFFAGTGYEGMGNYFRGLQGFGDSINLDAFPVAADNLIDDMQEQLVEGLFQDDIFVWWTDGYAEEISRGHDTGASQFEAVATGRGDEGGVTRISDATRNRFSRAVAEVFFNVLRFDFGNVEGDLLGDLYQRYFDPETRKALGEFYTPQPVVDYIMDGVGYERGVSNERLMDPACGSGTFLVNAVERYIEDIEKYEDDPDWKEHLQDLCTRPRVVGLDIHPFAVLMAQIRFVVAILPAYRQAKQSHPNYTIRRLPIYRTDTLRNERELTGADLGDDNSRQMTFDAMTEDEQDVRIPVPLPVEVDDNEVAETEDGFLVRRVRMPLFDTIQLETGVQNFGEYFAALQGVLDTVKDHMPLAEEFGDDFDWSYQSGLEERINHHTERDYDGVEEFFAPYVDDMLENVRYLKEEHNDGRLFKMFEDTVLALVVKNYMTYDYVVGNPPYVRIQNLPDNQKRMLDELYEATTGNYDIYCPFYERGLDWLRDSTGELGFITSNQFFVTNYGEGLRNVIRKQSKVQKVCDFRDVPLFDGATNYPAILFLSPESDSKTRKNNEIRCIRLNGDVDRNEDSLTDRVMSKVRQHEGESGYEGKYVQVFDYPQDDLDNGYWSFCPPEERAVLRKVRQKGESQVHNVTDAIFHGTQPGWNKTYVVTSVNADRISSSDTGDTVTIVPRGESKEYEIETDLLRPWLQGRDVQRWRCEWTGQHVILPYRIEKRDDGIEVDVYSPEYLKENLPKTWDYFKSHEGVLKSREGGMMADREDWYAFTYPKSHHRFEQPKIIGRQFSDYAQFMLDSNGDWYFKGAYGVQLESHYQDKTDEICCQLNSKVLDFHFKHIATQKQGGYYAYRKQYIGESPCFVSEKEEFGTLRQASARIAEVLDLDSKTDRFPEAYLGDYDGELDYISYEWQTRRYPVNAEVQGDVEDDFTVQAGRSDTINDPAMYSDDRDARKRRAEYVHAAVDGRNVKSGEETTIPIPRSDDGVAALLDELEADVREVQETSIEEIEAEIDEAVYDLFELTADEREVVEEYLEIF